MYDVRTLYKKIYAITKTMSKVKEVMLKSLKINRKEMFVLIRFAEKLKDPKLGMYHFRIGDWRVIFDYLENKIYILRVDHRKDIYR